MIMPPSWRSRQNKKFSNANAIMLAYLRNRLSLFIYSKRMFNAARGFLWRLRGRMHLRRKQFVKCLWNLSRGLGVASKFHITSHLFLEAVIIKDFYLIATFGHTKPPHTQTQSQQGPETEIVFFIEHMLITCIFSQITFRASSVPVA